MTDDREGLIGLDGEWWTPAQVHDWCAKRMAHFDRMRREARDLVNANGTLKPNEIGTSAEAYRAHMKAYLPPGVS